MSVLLSAPHAGCFNHTGERDCDLLAEKAALYLHYLIPDSQLHVGYAVRDELDLNRDQSFDDPFRVKLRQAADRIKPLISLDIHSFPDADFNNADLAILDESPGTRYGRSLFEFLKARLPNHVEYYSGADNSIVTEMRAKGIPSILIEFNESLTNDELTPIGFVIVEWLIQEGYSF